MMELFSAGSLAEVDGCLRAIARRSDLATRLTQARDEILEAMRLETIEEAEKRLDAMRFGNMIDHDPNAHLGLPFAFIVGDDDAPIETWGSEANLFEARFAAIKQGFDHIRGQPETLSAQPFVTSATVESIA
jgi:hypothetical protein